LDLDLSRAPDATRATALGTRLWIAVLQGDSRADALRERCRAEIAPILPRLSKGQTAVVTLAEGTYRWLAMDDQRSGGLLHAALGDFVAVGALADAALCAVYCAFEAHLRGDERTAARTAAECRELAAHLDDDRLLCWAAWLSGLLDRWADRDGAAQQIATAATRFADMHDWRGLGWSLELLSWLAAASGRYVRAAELMGAADVHWRRFRVRLRALGPAGAERARWQAQVLKQLTPTSFHPLYDYGAGLPSSGVITLAVTLEGNS
jgi:non-specific serine/threonine protein kinase